MPHLMYSARPPVGRQERPRFRDHDFVAAVGEPVFELMSYFGSELTFWDPEAGGIYPMHLAGKRPGPPGVLRLDLTGLYIHDRAGEDDERIKRVIGPGVLDNAARRVKNYNLNWIKHVELGIAIGKRAYYLSTEIRENYPYGVAYPLPSPVGKALVQVRYGVDVLGAHELEITDDFSEADKAELTREIQHGVRDATGLPAEVEHLFDQPGQRGAEIRRTARNGVFGSFIVNLPDNVDDEARGNTGVAVSLRGTAKFPVGAHSYTSVEPSNGHGALGVARSPVSWALFRSDN